MSGELVVAVVSVVMAGLAGPVITAASTTGGQKRNFKNERTKQDRAEVRKLLDEAVEAMDLVESEAERLQTAYFEHGSRTMEPYEELLSRVEGAQRTLGRVKARLAIRLGNDEPIGTACAAALEHAAELSGELSRYLKGYATGSPTVLPRHTDIYDAVQAIGIARTALVVAAFEVVGASLDV
jgi:hypothetical protein